MSQLIKTETKSPTMPKMQGKLFAAFKIEPFVQSLIFGKGLSPADTIVPSAIGMNAHAAKSAMGGAVSVPGFITGLAWSLCALGARPEKIKRTAGRSACWPVRTHLSMAQAFSSMVPVSLPAVLKRSFWQP
jgi:hypothetical protein